MSDREKLLGLVIGGLLGLFAIFGVYRIVSGGISSKESQITSLREDLKKKNETNRNAKHDLAMVNEYMARSLPADPTTAHRLFVAWLEDQVKSAGLEKDAVRFDGVPGGDDVQRGLSGLGQHPSQL